MSVGSRCRDDHGVTLIEMLAALTILGLIFVPLTGAVIIALKTTGTSSLRLTQSHDRQLVEVYFPRDASSSTSSPQVNATGACFTTGPSVVVLKWMGVPEISGVPATTLQLNYEADYVTQGGQLVRWYCQGATKTSLTTAYALSSSSPPTATISGKSITLTLTDSSGVAYSVTGQGRK